MGIEVTIVMGVVALLLSIYTPQEFIEEVLYVAAGTGVIPVLIIGEFITKKG